MDKHKKEDFTRSYKTNPVYSHNRHRHPASPNSRKMKKHHYRYLFEVLKSDNNSDKLDLIESEREFLRVIKKGDVFSVKMFLDKGVPVNYKFRTSVEGMIPLQIGCLNGQFRLVQYLVDRGGDVNFRCPRLNNWSTLHLSILNIKDFKRVYRTLHILFDHGAEWRTKDNNGEDFLVALDRKKGNLEDSSSNNNNNNEKKKGGYKFYFQRSELMKLIEGYFLKNFSLRVRFNQCCSRCRNKPFVAKKSFIKGGASYCMHCRDVFPVQFHIDDNCNGILVDEGDDDEDEIVEEVGELENLGIFNKNELIRIVEEQRKEIRKLKEVILLKEKIVVEKEKEIMGLVKE